MPHAPTLPGEPLEASSPLAPELEPLLAEASATEVPAPAVCVRLARAHLARRAAAEACRWAVAATSADDFTTWQAAAAVVSRCGPELASLGRRSARVAVLGSYTTGQFASMLRLAGLRCGVAIELYESDYGQYRQEILDPGSRLYAFAPDFVVLAVHAGDVGLPELSEAPERDVEAELERWTGLWSALAQGSAARVVQHTFAIPPEVPLGHLSTRTLGSRHRMLQSLNLRLGEAAGSGVSLVDCERLAGLVGKRQWFDPRYWTIAKQAVGLSAIPMLARHTAAVIAGALGLGRKCIVLDLDNTLWGGVVGEVGLGGIRIGAGGDGESFSMFQEYLLRLKERGIILAVASKNNEADAREPFEKHPDMRLRLDDFAAFVANWRPKPENLARIAEELNIGLDAMVFVDDNVAERHAVRQFLPEVDVIPLPEDPAQYTRCLAEYVHLEAGSFTPEDARRTDQYRARAHATELQASAGGLEDFHRQLAMSAVVAPFREDDLPRIAQLVAKSNQFNLTTRRHTHGQLERFMADPLCVHLSLRLRDRYTDHGLVSVMIAFVEGEALDIDTWLMSCRVIGRTVENAMLERLCRRAAELGCSQLRGTYVPTAKNAMVKEIFASFGFALEQDREGTTVWRYDLRANGPIRNDFIEISPAAEAVA